MSHTVNRNVTPGTIDVLHLMQHTVAMKKKAPDQPRELGAHFIRAWREHHKLSLDRTIELITDPGAVEPFITKTSLSRIERSQQVYSQPLLERLAAAFACRPADLLMRDPSETAEPWEIWNELNQGQKKQAVDMLKIIQNQA